MERESDRVGDVVERLRNAGYPFVQSEVRIPDAPGLRVDVLGWATDEAGELVPRLAVEVKHAQRPEVALPVLAQVRGALGTIEHYVVTDEGWFTGAPGLRTAEAIEGPQLCRNTGGELRSVSLATNLLRQRIWKESDRLRGQSVSLSSVFNEALSADDEQCAITTAAGDVLPVDPTTLWRARRAAWADLAEGDRMSSFSSSPPVIANAIASLVGERLAGTAVDPFSGSGAFLGALTERAEREGTHLNAIGRDVDPDIVQTASLIAQTAPSDVTFSIGDAFTTPLAEAELVVTAPPMGVRLTEPHELLNGSSTRDGDVAAVDVCLRALKPGGRAVFQLAPGITFRTPVEAFRAYLATEYRVAALIGCPSGSAFGTGIKTVLMVVDKAQASETFVAQLAEDWETQLGPTGPAMVAALEHIDGALEEAR